MQAIDKVRKWEKKWVTIGDTTMKIYKWVPITNYESGRERSKSKSSSSLMNPNNNKENIRDTKSGSSRTSSLTPSLVANEDSITGFSECSQEENNISNTSQMASIADETSNMSAGLLDNSTDAQFPDNCNANANNNDTNNYLKRESIQSNDSPIKKQKT